MIENGWISLYRNVLTNPIVCKDTHYFTIWIFLLLEATHQEQPKVFGGEKIMLQRGQLITGRKKIADKFNINESKVQRVLKTFKIEQMIEQQNSNKNRLITILNYNTYQLNEQQDEQQVNNKRTASEQQVNTNNNDNNVNNELIEQIQLLKNEIEKLKNDKSKRQSFIKPTVNEIREYCNERNNNIDAQSFFDYYEGSNWFRGKTKIKDWKAAVRTWEKNSKDKEPQQTNLRPTSHI